MFMFQKPRVYCKEGGFKSFICQNIPVVNENYWPTMWCFEGRLQCIFSRFTRSFFPAAPYIRYQVVCINIYIVSSFLF